MASTQMQSPADVLAALGPGVGLCGELAPFAGGSAGLPLAQRLAEHPLLMAPMAGVTDSAYRMMARAGGADLAYSEMVMNLLWICRFPDLYMHRKMYLTDPIRIDKG